MRRLISSGSPFEAAAGYSRAVADGEFVFVAGTTGFDYAVMAISDDPAEQARQALRNIEAVLTEAFGRIRPAATALICGLVDPRIKIEIEVTARRGGARAP